MFTTHEARFKLWDLIKGVKFTMFGTHQLSGGMRSRPMTTQNSELAEDECLWFFMSRTGESFNDIGRDSNVNLSYADPGRDVYVSVSGIAHVENSPERSRSLWSKFAQVWFRGGVDDPDLALIKVRITHAEYWDVEKSKIIELFIPPEG